MRYARTDALAYARRWAFARNPAFADFDGMGGDCTNFISQCLLAGSGMMNYTPEVGWYYRSLADRSAAWSGVAFLHTFLIRNQGVGPYGRELPLAAALPGDVIQLSFDGARFGHSLLITRIDGTADLPTLYLTAHTYDALDRPLLSYDFRALRLIHIDGVRR